MKKRNNVVYWIATIWLCLGMFSTGMVQLLQIPDEVSLMEHLGYPLYFLTILGIWKMLGVIAMLLPKFALLKEWAYAGFFFSMSGAMVSHLMVHDAITDLFGPVILIILTLLSWYFRPEQRKALTIKNLS